MPHKFAFFGTPEVARQTLETLLARGFAPAVVVTNPDAPKGRGLELAPSPVKELAAERGIPTFTPRSLDADFMRELAAYGCEYAVVVAYGKIFPESLITAFPKGVVNVHYSLLPKYRGATPLEGALRAGETETGATVQQMAYEIDSGDILAQEATPIGQGETARELRPRLITLGAELLADTLPALEAGTLAPRKQDASAATHSGKLKKEDGLLDLSASAKENWDKYRAYADSIGTYFLKDGKRVKITAAAWKDGSFVPERVIPEGKREMAYADFARA